MSSEIQNDSVRVDIVGESSASIRNKAVSRGSFRRSSGRVTPDSAGEDVGLIMSRREMKNEEGKKKSYKMTFLVLIQVLVMLLVLGFLAASLLVRVLRNRIAGGLEIWKWCLFSLSVVFGFTLVVWFYWPVIAFFEFMLSKNWLQPQVVYFVYGVRKSWAFFVCWLWVLLMWLILMEHQIKDASPRAGKVLRITKRSLISLVCASFGWVLLTMGIRTLSVKYRFKRYFGRVEEAALHLGVIRSLAGTENKKPSWLDWFRMKKTKYQDKKLNNTFESKKLAFLNWDYFFDYDGDVKFKDTSLKGMYKIDTDGEATRVAHFIFDKVVKATTPNDQYLVNATALGDKGKTPKQENVANATTPEQKYLSAENPLLDEKQIKKLFEIFKARGVAPKSIDRESFTKWVVEVYRHRTTLMQGLQDNVNAIKQLNILLRTALVIVSIIPWLLWIEILTKNLLIAFLTSLAGGVAIFGQAVKMTLQSIIFVFVVHPFDIGDECIVDNTPLVVQQMNILTTIFLNANDEKTYYPNYVLSTKAISNSTKNTVDDGVNLDDALPSADQVSKLGDKMKDKLEAWKVVGAAAATEECVENDDNNDIEE